MTKHRFERDGFSLTLHAVARVQQRGIKQETVGLIISEGDLELHAGEGLMSVQISKKHAAKLQKNKFSHSPLDAARGVILLFDYSTRTIVTAMRATNKRGKRYSRQHPTRGNTSKKVPGEGVQNSVSLA